MSKVKITETILRDAHQSQIATRTTTDDILPIVEKLDKIEQVDVPLVGANSWVFSPNGKYPDGIADPTSKPETFARPGHINPLYAQDNGVLRRAGHTEASIDLARLAGLYPAAALIEIMNEDGTMARLPQLVEIAKEYGLKIISIKDLIEYRLRLESLVEKGEEVDMPTEHGHFRLIPFRQKSNGLEHIALIKGEWSEDEPVIVRVHSSCMTGDIFGSQRCDCGAQLHEAMKLIEKTGKA